VQLEDRDAVSPAGFSAHMMAMTETRTRFLNLGEITDALAELPSTMRAFVMMDGALLSPDGVDSYRGSYHDLAIEPVNTSYERTVGDLLGCLRAADGQTYEGYKGGQYLMHRETAVAVSQYSLCSQDYVTGVEVRDGAAVVVTEKVAY
jgi:hypothetical protein